MDIKKSNILIAIVVIVFACWGGSGSTDGMTELCLKDALAGGPTSVMVETYDRRYYRSRGPRIRTCVISHYCGDTTIEPLADSLGTDPAKPLKNAALRVRRLRNRLYRLHTDT